MMASLLRCQVKDGMWRQLLDHPESWEESSHRRLAMQIAFVPRAVEVVIRVVPFVRSFAHLTQVAVRINVTPSANQPLRAARP